MGPVIAIIAQLLTTELFIPYVCAAEFLYLDCKFLGGKPVY